MKMSWVFFFFIIAVASRTATRDKEFKKALELTLDMFYREKVLGGLLSDNSSVLPSVLHLGAGFGLTVTKQEDSVPHALHKQYKASTCAAALLGHVL